MKNAYKVIPAGKGIKNISAYEQMISYKEFLISLKDDTSVAEEFFDFCFERATITIKRCEKIRNDEFFVIADFSPEDAMEATIRFSDAIWYDEDNWIDV